MQRFLTDLNENFIVVKSQILYGSKFTIFDDSQAMINTVGYKKFNFKLQLLSIILKFAVVGCLSFYATFSFMSLLPFPLVECWTLLLLFVKEIVYIKKLPRK